MRMSSFVTSTSSITHLTGFSATASSSSISIGGIRRRRRSTTSLLNLHQCFGSVVVSINRSCSSSRWNLKRDCSSSDNQTVITAAPLPTTTSEEEQSQSESESESPPLVVISSASEVVRNFYGGINAHDLPSVEYLIADNCVYEDLVFPQPFLGRKAILEFFRTFTDSISTDLQFVIDDISDEDTLAVGVSWHLEWKGKPFPFSKGCSFYRLDIVNGKRQIIYGRDCVEPAIKSGETALVAIRGVAWLLQQFPKLAEWL